MGIFSKMSKKMNRICSKACDAISSFDSGLNKAEQREKLLREKCSNRCMNCMWLFDNLKNKNVIVGACGHNHCQKCFEKSEFCAACFGSLRETKPVIDEKQAIINSINDVYMFGLSHYELSRLILLFMMVYSICNLLIGM